MWLDQCEGKVSHRPAEASLVTEHPVWTEEEPKRQGKIPRLHQSGKELDSHLYHMRTLGIDGGSGRGKVPCSGICRCQRWQRSYLEIKHSRLTMDWLFFTGTVRIRRKVVMAIKHLYGATTLESLPLPALPMLS